MTTVFMAVKITSTLSMAVFAVNTPPVWGHAITGICSLLLLAIYCYLLNKNPTFGPQVLDDDYCSDDPEELITEQDQKKSPSTTK